ncbi:MAG: MoaD/ThiS family protein [Candidatus Bathyarchaeia archaeon]|nr:MoaD/ThiS family protein [Candidatus Bathyarchaeota archaeon]
MIVAVKLFGSLEKLAERKIIEINIEENNNIEVKTVLKKLIEIINKEEFKNILESPGNYVIFVDGVEISALNGLNSLIKNGSEIVIVPVVHGG